MFITKDVVLTLNEKKHYIIVFSTFKLPAKLY